MCSRIKLQQDEPITSQQIYLNPQNKSTAKQQFSFPKADRFQQIKTELSDYVYYEKTSTITKAAASIGKEIRKVFQIKDQEKPSPNCYLYAGQGEFGYRLRKKSKKGGYMGLGRSVSSQLFRKQKQTISFNQVNRAQTTSTIQKQLSSEADNSVSQNKNEISKAQIKQISATSDQAATESKLHYNKTNKYCPISSRVHAPKQQKQKYKTEKRQMEKNRLYVVIVDSLDQPRITAKGELLDMSGTNKGFKIGHAKRSEILKVQTIPGPGFYKIFSQFPTKSKS